VLCGYNCRLGVSGYCYVCDQLICGFSDPGVEQETRDEGVTCEKRVNGARIGC